MKKLFSVLLVLLILASCKNNSSKQSDEEITEIQEVKEIPVPEGQQRYEGDFVYAVDAAVLTANNNFYAVKIDSMMKKLNSIAEALKENEYDAVNVVIHGIEEPNPMRVETGEGWEKMITIKKIIEVTPAINSQVITTGNRKLPKNDTK
ncbi:hypothetical protein BST97_10430 [Nonlabens spongiae]|uniref:OmpA-like domain-containing protein n=1 Tax=Nonlabens spongiae TaxID=331648 RepID=A0A1W6MLM3_9FLAO|nr:hypothetical protein [Nonlabens spongiae]ARN78369.1 hypothetical protein BST97_10430 [Nonlabens spongiae]